ncbi:hypothetical protein CBL_02626 [Carabus blaptoides fortunei]
MHHLNRTVNAGIQNTNIILPQKDDIKSAPSVSLCALAHINLPTLCRDEPTVGDVIFIWRSGALSQHTACWLILATMAGGGPRNRLHACNAAVHLQTEPAGGQETSRTGGEPLEWQKCILEIATGQSSIS